MSPNYFLKNGTFNTIYSSSPIRSIHQSKKIRYLDNVSEELIFESSAGIKLQYFSSPSAQKAVIFLPGFLGNKNSKYLVGHAYNAMQVGAQIIRIHPVDHGESEHLNYDFFKATDISAILELIHEILNNSPRTSFNLVGFSLGGNIALRVSQFTLHSNLEKVIAISPVLNPQQAMKAMDTNSKLINQYFLRKWKKSIANKQKYFPGLALEKCLKLKSLLAITEFFRARNGEFASLEDLFDDYAICGTDLSSPIRKTIILSSKDDPCIPIDPLLKINANELLDITITENGGHCGFLENFAFKSSLEDWMIGKLYE